MRKKKTNKTKTKEVYVKKMKVESWVKANKYSDYKDILLALFNSQDMVSELQLDKALKTHLEREV